MEPVDDAHALCHGAEHHRALVGGEHAARGGDAEDEEVRRAAGRRDRLGEVGDDGDAVGAVAEHLAGVAAGLAAVDDRQDLVALRVADEPVGGLAVDGAEVGLAVDDRGAAGGRRRQ